MNRPEMANRHMKNIFYILREGQIKATVRDPYTPTCDSDGLKLKGLVIPSVGKGGGQLAFSYVIGENVKWYSPLEDSWVVSYLNIQLTIWPSIFTPRY